MRFTKVLSALLAAWLTAASASAAVAHVQTSKTIDNDGNATVTTASMTFSAAGLALVGINAAANTTAPTISTVKLDGSTSFTVDKSTSQVTGGIGVLSGIASLPNISAGGHTVTVTFSGNVIAATVFLTEVSGAATSSIADGTGAAAAGGPTITATSGTFTTTNATDFWYSTMANFTGANPATITAGSGWTIPTNGSETNGASNQVAGVEYQANPGLTSGTASMTIDNTEWNIVAFAYNVSGGGGGGGTAKRMMTMGVGQ